jgi:hypothetical protein
MSDEDGFLVGLGATLALSGAALFVLLAVLFYGVLTWI